METNSTGRIKRISESIIEVKYRLAELYNAATESKADRLKLKTDMAEILKRLDKIEGDYSDHEQWLSEIDNRVNDIERSMINRF